MKGITTLTLFSQQKVNSTNVHELLLGKSVFYVASESHLIVTQASLATDDRRSFV